MNYLKIYLYGPFHYYYKKSNYVVATSKTYYKTEAHPTKKAVIGMIGAALGIERNDRRLEELYNDLDIKYHIVKKGHKFFDFQTARPFKEDDFFVTVDGKPTRDGVTKHVEYLSDAAFDVYIGGDDALLDEIYRAFLNPVWLPYLGKRNCLNTEPIVKDSKKEIYTREELEYVYDCD